MRKAERDSERDSQREIGERVRIQDGELRHLHRINTVPKAE